MARLALTVARTTLGSYPVLPLTINSVDFAFTAAGADFADGFSFPWNANAILLVKNANVAEKTVTITSTARSDSKRTGSITAYAMAAGDYAVFGPFEADGWRQTADGKVYGAANAADVEFAVINLDFNV